jgi:hypothetical protein
MAKWNNRTRVHSVQFEWELEPQPGQCVCLGTPRGLVLRSELLLLASRSKDESKMPNSPRSKYGSGIACSSADACFSLRC